MKILRLPLLLSAALLVCLPGFAQGLLPYAGPDWRWTPPFALTPSESLPAAWGGWEPAAASNGEEILVVWTASQRILATRIGSDGSLLDEYPALIGSKGTVDPADSNQRAPSVAWNGERWLVAWQADWFAIEAQWVGRDGRPEGVPFLLPGDAFGGNYGLATNGSSILVAAGALPLKLTLVHADGFVSATKDIPDERYGAVASDGTDYIVLTQGVASEPGSAVYHVSGADGIPVQTAERPELGWAGVGWTGEDYLAVTRHPESLAQRFGADGHPVGATIPLPTAEIAWASILAQGGGDALVAVGHYDTATPVRLIPIAGQTAGAPRDAAPGTRPSLVRSSIDVLVWSDDTTIRHAVLDGLELVPAEGVPTAPSSPWQEARSTVATSAGFVAVWYEHREQSDSLRGAFVTTRGETLPATTIAEIDAPYGRVAPGVASSGETVLVAWYAPRPDGLAALHARRLTANGEVLDQAPLVLAGELAWGWLNSQSGLAAHWNGEIFLVAWPGENGIRVARVTADGIVLDWGGVALPASDRGRPSIQDFVSIATAGEVTIVAWQDGLFLPHGCQFICTDFPPSARIELVRLDRQIGVLDPVPLLVTPEAPRVQPEIAASGDVFLIVALGVSGIEALRLDANGTPLDSAWLSGLFPLVWNDLIDGDVTGVTAAPGGFVVAAAKDGVHLVFVPISGSASPPVLVGGEEYADAPPSLAVRQDGTTLVVHSRWNGGEGLVLRATGQILAPPAPRRRAVTR